MPLIVKTVAVGQYVVKVATTLVTVVVPNSPLVTTPVLTLEVEERETVTAVPELALEVEDAVLEATVLFVRVTAVCAETQAARAAGTAKIEKRIFDS